MIEPDYSSTYANDPLLSLLGRSREQPVMTQDQMREHVNKLRTARMSPQALGRMLRADAVKEAAKQAPKERTDSSAGDIYKSLGL